MKRTPPRRAGLVPPLVLLLFLPAALRAQEGAGATGIELLGLPLGPRAVALGGAGTSRGGSLEAILYNPAGIGDLEAVHVGLSHHSSLNFRQLFFAVGLPVGRLGAAALSLKRFEFDEQVITGPGGPEDVLTRFSPNATEARLTLSGKLGPRVRLGASLALNGVELAPPGLATALPGDDGFRGRDTSLGLDVGVLVEPAPDVPLSVGAGLLSVGRGMAFFEGAEREPLPRRLRAGMSLELLRWLAPGLTDRLGLLVALDSEQPLVGGAELGSNVQHAGVELQLEGLAFLRAGIERDPLDAEPTAALGLGVRLKGIGVDFARLVAGNEFRSEDTHVLVDIAF